MQNCLEILSLLSPKTASLEMRGSVRGNIQPSDVAAMLSGLSDEHMLLIDLIFSSSKRDYAGLEHWCIVKGFKEYSALQHMTYIQCQTAFRAAIKVVISGEGHCKKCKGTGIFANEKHHVCSVCGGSGSATLNKSQLAKLAGITRQTWSQNKNIQQAYVVFGSFLEGLMVDISGHLIEQLRSNEANELAA